MISQIILKAAYLINGEGDNEEHIRKELSTLGTGQAYVNDRLSFSSFDSEIRRAAIRRIKDHIQLASQLGAKVIIGSIRGPLPGIVVDLCRAVQRNLGPSLK